MLRKITKKQAEALKRKYEIDSQGMTYWKFRHTVMYYGDFIGVIWCNMFLGIEQDGYTHS
jgi:hypothetical protein